MTCLLCPSPAVADGLCVADGARKWAADLWMSRPIEAAWLTSKEAKEPHRSPERNVALCEMPTGFAARAFLDRLEAARKARDAAPQCSRGCESHESVNSYGGAKESDDGT